MLGVPRFPRRIASASRAERNGDVQGELVLARSRFTCLPEDRGQFQTTIRALPDESESSAACGAALPMRRRGGWRVSAIEWYIHTQADPSLSDREGHHSSALFVQWVPYEIKGSSWEAEESRYVQHLLSICDRFAPGTSDLVVDAMPLHPQKIEAYFGIHRGHIHHVDNTFGFADRLPYQTPIAGLYACGAGCHPAGSVIGAAGHNAAMRVLADGGGRRG
jgi:phytoene dehydrogenase-like protein